MIFAIEFALVVFIGITARKRHEPNNFLHRGLSTVLIGLITVANISSLLMVLNELIRSDRIITGYELLASAVAIFLTNIIVFGLWYWEIDSPGLTGKSWTKNDQDFYLHNRNTQAHTQIGSQYFLIICMFLSRMQLILPRQTLGQLRCMPKG